MIIKTRLARPAPKKPELGPGAGPRQLSWAADEARGKHENSVNTRARHLRETICRDSNDRNRSLSDCARPIDATTGHQLDWCTSEGFPLSSGNLPLAALGERVAQQRVAWPFIESAGRLFRVSASAQMRSVCAQRVTLNSDIFQLATSGLDELFARTNVAFVAHLGPFGLVEFELSLYSQASGL